MSNSQRVQSFINQLRNEVIAYERSRGRPENRGRDIMIYLGHEEFDLLVSSEEFRKQNPMLSGHRDDIYTFQGRSVYRVVEDSHFHICFK